MSSSVSRLRRFVPGAVALAVIGTLFGVARIPTVSAAEHKQLASEFSFTKMPIAMPAGYQPTQHIRQVNPAYKHIQAWISSVGAGVALNDLSGSGLPDDLCISDPRTDQVVVTYAPDAPASDRFTPFILDPAPLPMDKKMAPTGCVPGDYNEDGRMDLLVYYMGRTPILFLAKSDATSLSPSAYQPTELIPHNGVVDGMYHGPRWQTTAINVADYDGDGHADIYVGNYFPDSDVLDPEGENNVQMNLSMSNARNAGGAHVLCWHDATSGTHPRVRYMEIPKAVPFSSSTGWTLALASADLDGDGLPEVYVANDFGPDHLLYNVSTRGHIEFRNVTASRTPTTPKSLALGHDSFKGMGVDFGDMRNRGAYDMFVGNITTPYGLLESNMLWLNETDSKAEMRQKLQDGVAPFRNDAAGEGLAWTGWAWDDKFADFTNSGTLSIVQADGFVKGHINRWPWLQELAMTNDMLLSDPKMWPKAQDGDDIAGHQTLKFWVRRDGDSGKFVNIAKQLGMAIPSPSRGIAIADTTGTGHPSFAVAYQWAEPVFYHNDLANNNKFLGLHLFRPVAGNTHSGLQQLGTPAYEAEALVTMADGRKQLSRVDGGSGHSGKRSFDIYFGLGPNSQPVQVDLSWRDLHGQLHKQTLHLAPGWHNFILDGNAQEVPAS